MTIPKIEVQVGQTELESIAKHRREIAWHREQLKPMEKNILDLLIAGADVERGRFEASLEYLRRRPVAWRAIVEQRLGAEAAEEIYKSTKLIHIPQLKIVEHPADDLQLFLDLGLHL